MGSVMVRFGDSLKSRGRVINGFSLRGWVTAAAVARVDAQARVEIRGSSGRAFGTCLQGTDWALVAAREGATALSRLQTLGVASTHGGLIAGGQIRVGTLKPSPPHRGSGVGGGCRVWPGEAAVWACDLHLWPWRPVPRGRRIRGHASVLRHRLECGAGASTGTWKRLAKGTGASLASVEGACVGGMAGSVLGGSRCRRRLVGPEPSRNLPRDAACPLEVKDAL